MEFLPAQRFLPALTELMSRDGIIVCEHERGLVLPDETGVMIRKKTYRYGKIEVTVYRNSQAGDL